MDYYSTASVTYPTVSVDGSDAPNQTTESDSSTLCNVTSTAMITSSEATKLAVIVYCGIIPVLCLIGILGNILNLAVLTHRSWKHLDRLEMFAKTGLIALATADMGVCMSTLPWWFIYNGRPAVSKSLTFGIIYTTYSPFLINTFMLTSTLFTVALAVSRYMASRWPIEMRARMNKTLSRGMIFVVIATSTLYNLPRLWTFKINTCTQDSSLYYYVTYGLLYQSRPHLIYSSVYFGVAVAIPMVLLTLCTVLLIRTMRRSQRYCLQYTPSAKGLQTSISERQHIHTLVLVSIVLMHILLVSPGRLAQFVAQMLKVVSESPTYTTVVAVVNVLEVCNYTFNFILYCTLNRHFRYVIHRAATKCCCLCNKAGKHTHNSTQPQEQVELFSKFPGHC